MVTAEQLWASIVEGVAGNPNGPMAHFAKKLAAIERGEGGAERRAEILRAIDTLLRSLLADPESAAALRSGDTDRVTRAIVAMFA
jgi:hypothetical protein